ncbi:MAG: DUF2892 domain-containing protein [Halioglobus sp.]
MIERNLGNAERIVRLLMAVVFGGWAVSQPAMNGVEWFVVAISLMLILNGIFSRCYLWYVLDIDTDSKNNGSTPSTIY